MGQYTSYYLYQKYESRNGQDPVPCSPSVYSIDADGTMEKVIKLENDPDCGYTPPPTEPIYRWYQMPISEDYICAECETPPTPTGETIYRWVESGTTCIGYDKWQRSIQQYSEDEGETWYNVDPPVYSATSLIEADSQDCGYVPPTPTNLKLHLVYTDYSTYEIECDSTSAVTKQEVSGGSQTSPNILFATIGSCVETIKGSSFNGSSAMTSVNIPNSVTKIESQAFRYCYSLTSVTIPNSVVNWEGLTFNNCTGLTTVNLPNNIATIPSYAFQFCTSLSAITIPNNFTEIGLSAFETCRSLTSVTIPNGLTTIGDNAFNQCNSLTNVTIPNSVTSIGSRAFTACSGLTSITLPNSITEIKYHTFWGCLNISNSITIPNTVTSIEEGAFAGCVNISSITINNTTPPTLGSDVFGTCYFDQQEPTYPIYVPAASVNAYKTATNWSSYANRILAIP